MATDRDRGSRDRDFRPLDPRLDTAERLKRKRITRLVLAGLALIALALWFAEAEEVAVARSVVWMVGHPFVAVPIFFAGIGVALAAVAGFFAAMRRMFPPMPGDQNVFVPFFRWLNAVPDVTGRSLEGTVPLVVPDQIPEWVVRSSRAPSPGPGGGSALPPASGRRIAVMLTAVSMVVALLSGGIYLLAGRGRPVPRGARAVGSCSPAPCAAVAGSTVYVLSVDNHYVATDLTPAQRGFLDGAQPPKGFRFVRVTVRIRPGSGVTATDPAKALELFDGVAARRPTNLLAVDRACHVSAPPTSPGVESGPYSMCFLARDLPHHQQLSLKWVPMGVSIPL